MDKSVLRLGFVPGVVPFKWVSRFRERFGEAALVTSRLGADDDAAQLLCDGELDAALLPVSQPGEFDEAAAQEVIRIQLVNKDDFHAIPLYIESDDQKGRVPGREIGLVWLRDLEHPLMEPLAGIVRGRTANSSRGASAASPNSADPKSPTPQAPQANSAPKSMPTTPRQVKAAPGKNVRSNAKPQNSKNSGRRQRRAK